MDPLYPPPSGPQPTMGSYAPAYPYTGLASLSQGLMQGIQIGHQFNQQAQQLDLERQRAQDTLEMHTKQMANEASWRESQAGETKTYHEGELKARKDQLQYLKDLAAKSGSAVLDEDGNVVGYNTAKGNIVTPKKATNTAKEDKQFNDANAFFLSVDQLGDLGKKFQPDLESMAPVHGIWDAIKANAANTDQAAYIGKRGEVGINAASVVGGRRSDPEIARLEENAGGYGNSLQSQAKRNAGTKQWMREKIGLPRTPSERYEQLEGKFGKGNDTKIYQQMRMEGYQDAL